MPRDKRESYNEREAMRGFGAAERDSQRVKQMQKVEGAHLPVVGETYYLSDFGEVEVLAVNRTGVRIVYLQRGRERITTVNPLLFNL